MTQDLNKIALPSERAIKDRASPDYQGGSENPRSALDKDSFMKLLLVELQYQDPTEPMDSEKILTQTSQLATLESAENTNKTMEKLVDRLNNNMDTGALSAIGKMASLGSNAVTLKDGEAKFEIYFKEEIKSGKLSFIDEDGEVVREIVLEDVLDDEDEPVFVGKNGVLAFAWDGTDDDGKQLPDGYYSVKSEYIDSNDEKQETQFGIYPVESVKYDDGTSYMKLGSSYVAMDYIAEFF